MDFLKVESSKINYFKYEWGFFSFYSQYYRCSYRTEEEKKNLL